MKERNPGFTVGRRKVAIIGAGFVGASIAYALTLRNLAREIALIDINKKKAEGEALDIQHGIPYMGMSAVYAGDYSDCTDCDLIIITAGRNRRVGESRLDMIKDNSAIMRNVVDSISKYYTHGVILVIANPVDILTSLCDRWMGLPNGMVFGTGCLLDTSRTVRAVADFVRLNTEVVRGYVVGEHGNSQITLWSNFSIGGTQIDDYCKSVGLEWSQSDKGKTHYGVATCVCSVADAILNQRPTIASVTSPLQSEYGVEGISLSVPSIIGVNGVEKRIEEKWSEEEFRSFKASAASLKDVLGRI